MALQRRGTRNRWRGQRRIRRQRGGTKATRWTSISAMFSRQTTWGHQPRSEAAEWRSKQSEREKAHEVAQGRQRYHCGTSHCATSSAQRGGGGGGNDGCRAPDTSKARRPLQHGAGRGKTPREPAPAIQAAPKTSAAGTEWKPTQATWPGGKQRDNKWPARPQLHARKTKTRAEQARPDDD